jgi:hypothetical protein
MGGMAAVESTRRLWVVMGVVALSFLAVCTLIIVVSVIAKG